MLFRSTFSKHQILQAVSSASGCATLTWPSSKANLGFLQCATTDPDGANKHISGGGGKCNVPSEITVAASSRNKVWLLGVLTASFTRTASKVACELLSLLQRRTFAVSHHLIEWPTYKWFLWRDGTGLIKHVGSTVVDQVQNAGVTVTWVDCPSLLRLCSSGPDVWTQTRQFNSPS